MPLKGPTQESLKYLAKRERELGLLLPFCVLIAMVGVSFGLIALVEGEWQLAAAIFLGCAALMTVIIVLIIGLRH